MILHYIKIAFRNLWKYKFQNVVGILGVSLGLVCFALCCYIPRFLAGWDKSYPDSDRMYGVVYEGESPSVELRNILRNQFPEDIEKTTYSFPPKKYDLQFGLDDDKNLPYEILLVEADTSILSFYSLEFISGNVQSAVQVVNSIVLFEKFSNKIGKPVDLIGKKMIADGKTYSISGIVKNLPKTSIYDQYGCSGFVLNVDGGYFEKAKDEPDRYDVDMIPVPIMLKKGIDVDKFQHKLDLTMRLGSGNEKFTISRYEPLDQEGIKTKMSIILIIGVLILLTGLFNYISFIISQFYNQLGGYAIRKVNGAGWINQFLMIFTEFLLVWLLAGGLSVFILYLFAPSFDSFKIPIIYSDLSFDFNLICKQLIEYILVGIPCIALLCVVPTLTIEKISINTALFGIVKKGNKMFFRNALLFIQMFIFIGFIAATIIVYLQMNKTSSSILTSLSSQEKENIFTIDCSRKQQLMDNKETLLRNIKSFPQVEKVMYAYTNFYLSYLCEIDPNTGISAFPNAVRQYISPDYPDFFNLKVISGRFFENESEPNLAVVDENFAALYGGENPIGKTFSAKMGGIFKIIGVIQNVQFYKSIPNGPYSKHKNPLVYYLADESPWQDYIIYVKAMPGSQNEVKKHIDKCVREFLPETIDYNIKTLDSVIQTQELKDETVLLKFGSIFGIVALFICLLSIYSSITLNTEKRRKEIAIRKINGAGIREIIYLFSKTYIGSLTLACLLMFPIIYFVGSKWLEQFSQRISLNLFFVVSIYISVLIIVVLTIIFRILKVSKENPSEVIKSE